MPMGWRSSSLKATSHSPTTPPTSQLPTDGSSRYNASSQNQGTAPIALDLNGNGLEFLPSSTTGTQFDFNGNGPEPTAWLAPTDGWLFVDLNNGGQVTRQELTFVSQVPSATTDLDALRLAYDTNHDNTLSALDSDWSKFKIWQDLNRDGISTANEIQSLDAAGITAIKLVSNGQVYAAASGTVTVVGQSSFVRSDGEIGIVGDVQLNTNVAQPIDGSFNFNGGPNSTYVADANTDWTLTAIRSRPATAARRWT